MIKHMVRLRHREEAFISIFTVMVIMALLTLVAVGFSNITRKAQRRVLDNQLNTQAFYAAESGVNDAKKVIETIGISSKTECQGAVGSSIFKYDLDTTLDVGYTCVLINSTLPDIEIASVPQEGNGSPKVVAFESSTNTAIKSFKVTWDATNELKGLATIADAPTYPNILSPDTTWGDDKLGVLRLDLAPSDGSLDRTTITDGSYTFFLYPSTNGGSGPYTVGTTIGNQGSLVQVDCANGTSPCSATINLSPGSSSKYVMRLQSLYNDTWVDISDVRDASPTPVSLQNAQTVVDVTGRASDVFRRIQVRLPIQTHGMLPSFAIQSADSICKRLLVGGTTVVDLAGTSGDPTATESCELVTGGTPVTPPPPPGCVNCFPGDPRPFFKAYWGASLEGNGSPSRHEGPTGVSLSSRRTYWQWDDAINASSNMYATIRNDLQNNRLPFISFKPPVTAGSAWQKVADGQYDTELRAIISRLESIGTTYQKPIWVVFHHEPEGGGTSGNTPDDPGGPVAWRAMQHKFRDLMTSLGTRHLAFMPILMSYTWNPSSGRDPNLWWEPGVWDAFVVDHFQTNAGGTMFSDGTWNAFVSWIKDPSRNLPFGTGEWGNTCKQVSCAATAAAGGVEAANEMQAFWDAGFPVNDKNVVIHSYYDSGLNSSGSPFNSWRLQGRALSKFQDILKNDTRVMRINQIPPIP